MGRDIHAEADVKRQRKTKLVREGDFVAEVQVELIADESGWSPYLSVEDAKKLDVVRAALRARDFAAACAIAERVFRLERVSAS